MSVKVFCDSCGVEAIPVRYVWVGKAGAYGVNPDDRRELCQKCLGDLLKEFKDETEA